VHLQGGRTGEKKENAPPRGKCALRVNPPPDHHEPGKLNTQFKYINYYREKKNDILQKCRLSSKDSQAFKESSLIEI
jgi:hypothetical protein